jgi:hypothetical protein
VGFERKQQRADLSWKAQAGYILLGLITTGVVGWLDLLTGYEVSFSVFYLIPIALITWKIGRFGGIVISVASALTWLLVETILRSPTIFRWVAGYIPLLPPTIRVGPPYSSPVTPFWNAAVRFIFFLIITLLLARRRQGFPKE